jgi:hypothetical protein
MLAHAFDKKFFLLIQQRIVDGSSAKIHSGHEPHAISPLCLNGRSAQRSRIGNHRPTPRENEDLLAGKANLTIILQGVRVWSAQARWTRRGLIAND